MRTLILSAVLLAGAVAGLGDLSASVATSGWCELAIRGTLHFDIETGATCWGNPSNCCRF